MLKLKMNNSVSLVTNSWPKSSPAAFFFISEPSGCFGDRKLWLRSRRRVPAAIWQSEFPIQNLQFGEFTSHVWSLFIVCWGEKWENQQKMQLILYIYMVIFTSIYHLPGKAMIFQQPENRQSPGRQSCDWSTHHLASWKLGGVHKNLPNQIPKFTHHCFFSFWAIWSSAARQRDTWNSDAILHGPLHVSEAQTLH